MEHKRKCIACGELKPRSELIKLTKEFLTNNVVINPNSKTFGRSAYLCYNRSCIEQALKKKKLNRALKLNISTDLKGLLEDGQFKS